jgi:hypothetical protein
MEAGFYAMVPLWSRDTRKWRLKTSVTCEAVSAAESTDRCTHPPAVTGTTTYRPSAATSARGIASLCCEVGTSVTYDETRGVPVVGSGTAAGLVEARHVLQL